MSIVPVRDCERILFKRFTTEDTDDLHGCRRYDPKDGGGRIASGTAIESNAGAIAEAMQEQLPRTRSFNIDFLRVLRALCGE